MLRVVPYTPPSRFLPHIVGGQRRRFISKPFSNLWQTISPLRQGMSGLNIRSPLATRHNQQFPPLAELGVTKQHIDAIFTHMLASLDMPYVEPATNRIRREGFFKELEAIVHKYDPSAQVYLSGGTIRNLFGCLYEELMYARETSKESLENILQKMAEGKYTFRCQSRGSLSKLAVLGMGSDLDIQIQFSQGFTGKEEVTKAVRRFINALQNRLPSDASRDPFLAHADVKERDPQVDRAVSQGGSPLDWFAYPVTPNSGNGLVAPRGHHNLIDQILQGNLPYLPTTNAEDPTVTALRVLRSTMDLPCLTLSSRDEKIWAEELRQIQIKHPSTFSPRVRQVFTKALANVRFVGKWNELASTDREPLCLVRKISDMFPRESKNVPLVPLMLEGSYIQSRKEDYDPGDLKKDGDLLPEKDYLARHTDNGWLYHGTPDPNNILPMIRGAFVVSSSQQGTAVFGSGLYSSSDYKVSEGYATQSGIIVPLQPISSPKLRILDINSLASSNPGKLQRMREEAAKNNIDLNLHLSREYGIDIIISGGHSIIQNSKCVEQFRTIENFLQSLDKYLMKLYESMKTEKDFAVFRSKFTIYASLAITYFENISFVNIFKTSKKLNNALILLQKKDRTQLLTNVLSWINTNPNADMIYLFKQILNSGTVSFSSHFANVFWGAMMSTFRQNPMLAKELFESVMSNTHLSKDIPQSLNGDRQFIVDLFKSGIIPESNKMQLLLAVIENHPMDILADILDQSSHGQEFLNSKDFQNALNNLNETQRTKAFRSTLLACGLESSDTLFHLFSKIITSGPILYSSDLAAELRRMFLLASRLGLNLGKDLYQSILLCSPDIQEKRLQSIQNPALIEEFLKGDYISEKERAVMFLALLQQKNSHTADNIFEQYSPIQAPKTSKIFHGILKSLSEKDRTNILSNTLSYLNENSFDIILPLLELILESGSLSYGHPMRTFNEYDYRNNCTSYHTVRNGNSEISTAFHAALVSIYTNDVKREKFVQLFRGDPSLFHHVTNGYSTT